MKFKPNPRSFPKAITSYIARTSSKSNKSEYRSRGFFEHSIDTEKLLISLLFPNIGRNPYLPSIYSLAWYSIYRKPTTSLPFPAPIARITVGTSGTAGIPTDQMNPNITKSYIYPLSHIIFFLYIYKYRSMARYTIGF
jgi:hypothetical protein